MSNDDRPAMQIADNSIKRINHFKFQIAVPFRHINPNMPDNYKQAAARLEQQRRNLCKDEQLKTKYVEKIKRLREEGYIEPVPSNETVKPGRVWYLPHFSTKQNKFCVVYDGAAKFHERAINNEILSGTDLLVLLFNVITRFRMGRYVIIADLKECFFQIGIPPEQRDYFRILWYADDNIDSEI